ncbi:MAG: YraN family protein [Vicinamibacteraceae bacterium]|nr:YraN family protein [Vicinamibacteraceae bacterium]
MTLERLRMGAGGEDAACEALRRRGYAILARRFRTRSGELDIVARDGDTLVFVEVKARRSLRAGLPAEAVTWRKRRTLHRVALEFLARSRLHHLPCRFDIVSVRMGPGGEPTGVEIVPGAFSVGE